MTSSTALTSLTWLFYTNINGAFTGIVVDGVNYGGGSTNSPSLIIYNVDGNDQGNYICRARNVIGTTDSATLSLTVTGSK